MDNKTPIADVVAKAAKDAGASITLKNYVRFQLGEGIEKETSDFAAEVAAAAGVWSRPNLIRRSVRAALGSNASRQAGRRR